MPKTKIAFPETHPNFWANLGPSLVAIGLGLGSGEFILWPYLSVNYGYGILWGALIGITFQVLLNIEIQRFSSVSGENFLQGAMRFSKLFGFWFIFSTLIGFGWPGFSASAGYLLANISDSFAVSPTLLSYAVLIACGGILLAGHSVYERIEKLLKIIIPINFVIILLIFVNYFDFSAFIALLQGFVGRGNNYSFIPSGIDLGILLGAFAYAGSGGNLLLGQSFYVIEKKLGLSKLSKPKRDEIFVAKEDQTSRKNFIALRNFQISENVLVFGGMGLLMIAMLSYLGPILVSDTTGVSSNISFLIKESSTIQQDLGNLFAKLYLLAGAIALASVQLGVFDLMGRITSFVTTKLLPKTTLRPLTIYRFAVLAQLMFGIIIFSIGLSEPFWLLRLGAILNAGAMAVIGFLTIFLNNTAIPRMYRPNVISNVSIAIISLLYAVFFFIVLF